MNLCPECGNPPAYTSFCTLCAQLFMARPAKDALANGTSAKAIAEQLGCSLATVYRLRKALGLPLLGKCGRPRKIREDAHP